MFRHVEIWERVRDSKTRAITHHQLLRIVYTDSPFGVVLSDWLEDKPDCYCENFDNTNWQ